MLIASEAVVRDDRCGGAAMKVRPGAVVRGAGVAIACLAPERSKRSTILLAGFAGAWFLNRRGLQISPVTPARDGPGRRARVPCPPWVAAGRAVRLAARSGVRTRRLPPPIAALL